MARYDHQYVWMKERLKGCDDIIDALYNCIVSHYIILDFLGIGGSAEGLCVFRLGGGVGCSVG